MKRAGNDMLGDRRQRNPARAKGIELLQSQSAKLAETQILIFNNRLDAAVTGLFMLLVAIVVLDAARVWWQTLRPRGAAPAAAEVTA